MITINPPIRPIAEICYFAAGPILYVSSLSNCLFQAATCAYPSVNEIIKGHSVQHVVSGTGFNTANPFDSKL